MPRTWRSQIADEVRACSMMAPKNRIRVDRIQHYKGAVCHECGAEFLDRDCEAQAKQHARDTGHSPTLRIEYDLFVRRE